MAKYIFKESELSSILNNIIMEEINKSINEGVFKALGNAALNTAAFGAKAMLSPLTAAGSVISKLSNITNGNDTIGGTVSDFFGGPATGSSSSSSSGGSRRQTRSQKQSERYRAGRDVSFEYGRPETIPGWGNRLKLDKKTEIVVPEEVLDNTGKCVQWGSKTGQWGSFGKHYHDEGDRMWQRVFKDKENALIRNCRNNQSKLERLKRKYKRILLNWLKDRDMAYEEYIKTHNRA